MTKKKRINWGFGDVFLVPLKNGTWGVGQILDLQMPTIVRCALFSEIVQDKNNIQLNDYCSKDKLVSLIAATREQLDFGVWLVVGNKPIEIPKKDFPNEKYSPTWINAKHYDASLLEDFLNAYHRLIPWDDWFNPNYLDEFLVDPAKKPANLLLIKSKSSKHFE